MIVAFGLALALSPSAHALFAPSQLGGPTTERRLIHYRAHDGAIREAWLLLPSGYHGQRIPLVISPHGRGVGAGLNALLWGNLPGEGDVAAVNPAGQGRRLRYY